MNAQRSLHGLTRKIARDERGCPLNRPAHITRLLLLVLLLAAALALAACGDEEEATPTPVSAGELTAGAIAATADAGAAVAPAPESPLPTPTTAEATATTQAADAAQPTVTVTVTMAANGSTAVFVPLEVDPGIDCEIESHIDLAGYPNLEELLGCPTAPAILDPIGINEFGEGPDFNRFMLWFSHENQIYVLFPDGSWQSYADTWQESELTYPCNPFGGEADSPPLPRRGFGKLWCSNPAIQEVMGTVPREERLCQHSVLQQFAGGRLLACFEDATIRYFRLLDDHTWDVVAQ